MNINKAISYNIITRLINNVRHCSKIISMLQMALILNMYKLLISLIYTGNAFHNFTPQTDIHIAFKFVREYLTINVFLLRVL